MVDLYEKDGFKLLEEHFDDLDVYQRDNVALIVMKRYKNDKKQARQAANHLDPVLIQDLSKAFTYVEKKDDVESMILASNQRFVFSRGAT